MLTPPTSALSMVWNQDQKSLSLAVFFPAQARLVLKGKCPSRKHAFKKHMFNLCVFRRQETTASTLSNWVGLKELRKVPWSHPGLVISWDPGESLHTLTHLPHLSLPKIIDRERRNWGCSSVVECLLVRNNILAILLHTIKGMRGCIWILWRFEEYINK